MEANTVETYADKIDKLLRKAESTNHAGEAEVFLKKAQQLMVKYAIDEEMLARVRGEGETDVIIEDDTTRYTGIFQRQLFDIGAVIARANGCKVLIHSVTAGRGRDWTELFIVGFKKDVERVKLLDASVQIQATGALTKWWKTAQQPWMTKMDKYRERREFLGGFARGLRGQLAAATQAGQREAASAEAERSDVSDAEASASVALVLRTKQERVEDWYDEKYGSTTRRVRTNYQRGGVAASSAGQSAGSRADVSSRGAVRGNQRGLNR